MRLTVTGNLLAQLDTFSLTLLNGASESNTVTVSVVPAGLPPAPSLISINPSQLPSSEDPQPTWVTLTGSNFVQDDTVVKPSFTAPPLQTQVVSDSQMKVLIPAIWQVTPMSLQLHAESSQDPALKSQAINFEILNTANILQPATPPVITAVGDGFVRLATSPSDPATTVTLEGSNFQPGSQVVINVDGVTTTVPATSVSPTTLQAQIPAQTFDLKTYTFSLDLQLQGAAAQGQPHPRARQKANTHKVTFDNVAQYDGAPGFSPLAGLGGFHTRTLNQNPGTFPDYFLMVPRDAPGNMAEAITSSDVLPLQVLTQANGGSPTVTLGRVTFEFGNTTLFASVVPPSTSNRIQDFTVTGNGSVQSDTSPLNATTTTTSNKTKTKTKVGVLNLQLMPPTAYNVNLHFVSGKAPGNAPCAVPLIPIRTPATVADERNLQTVIQDNLDQIWLKQANVKFTVNWNPPANPNNCLGNAALTEQVEYDLGDRFGNPPPDGKLQVRKPNGDPNDPHNIETDTIIATIPLPSPNDINIYFVKQFATKYLEIDTAAGPLKNGFINSQYQAFVIAKGGKFPYNWAITQGGLPPGLVANTSAAGVYVITGTPTQQGAFNFTLQVTDQDNQLATSAFTINIGTPLIGPPAPFPPIPAPITGTVTFGFVTKVGEHTIFIDDNTDDQVLFHVIAHEIGHALGLTHMSEHQASDSADNTSCTAIPGLHAADSDFSDRTDLMWWYVDRQSVQSHLGIRNWIQLNNHATNPGCIP